MAYFLGKNYKDRLSVGGSAPEPPFASSGWGLGLQTPALLLPLTITNLSNLFLVLNAILFRSKKNQVTTANLQPLPLPHFCTYFLIQTV